MTNIIGYVTEYGNKTFAERPLGETDSLVFSQLAYLKYDHFPVKRGQTMSMSSLFADPEAERLFLRVRDPESNKKLFSVVASSERFSRILVSCYVNDVEPKSEKQFSAVSFIAPECFMYIAYRGTDSTIVGWKEDMNMSFLPELPSQTEGAKYLSSAAEIADLPICVGGHSKGGNIAVYASFSAGQRVESRIVSVFNHDGPGFLPQVYDSISYRDIASRIKKTIPQSSLFGMLLQQHGEYRIVKSDRLGVNQHDPFSWQTEGIDFVVADKLTSAAILRDRTINDWMYSLDDATRKLFIDTVFEIIGSTEASTFADISASLGQSTKSAFKTLRNVDPETKKIILSASASLIKSAAVHIGQLQEAFSFPRPKLLLASESKKVRDENQNQIQSR